LSSGLVENQSVLIILDLVIINLIHLINPSYQAKRFYRLI